MEIFFTSISHGKLGRLLNEIYMPMKRALSAALADKDYGPGVKEWFLAFVMLPEGLPGYGEPEVIQFKKKTKTFDLRLDIQNKDFHHADEAGRKALVVACMMRSLDLIAERKIPDFDIQALKADVAAVVHEQGWVAAPSA